LLSSQWYLKYDGIKEAAKKMVEDGKVTIHPESMVSKFNHWMDNLRDWAISRSLWWGYRLPVWYHGEVKEEIGENGEVRELIKLGGGGQEAGGSKGDELRAEGLEQKTILVDAVGTLINSNESKDIESYSLNNVLAEYLSRLANKIIVVTNATDESLSAIDELLRDYKFEIYTLHKNPDKSESEYFEKLISNFNLKSKNIIYIDHKDKNVNAAVKAGILNSLVSDSNEHRIKFIDELTTKHETLDTRSEHQTPNTEHWQPLEYNNPNHLRVQKESPGEGWFQDENVLDTWFSSGQWVYATLEKYGLMKEFFPTDVMVSGFDILENWISRMMMFTYFKHKDVPFKNVYLTGLVKGTDGQKMSKSRGNVLSIDDLREKYGTDAVRMVYFYQNSAGADYAMTYEKLDTFKKFVNKLWNASKFVLMNIEDMELGARSWELEFALPENKALYDHVVKTKNHITKNIEKFELGLATYNLYHAFWDEFADIHIEAVKKYTYTQKDKVTGEIISEPKPEDKLETQKVLLFALKEYLKMLHPFIPFVTERIWKEIPKQDGDHESLMYSRW
jgi:valyl-tRNA synthetase